MHKCSHDCTSGWGASRRAHCSGCGRNFGGLTAFDKHRDEGKCLDPESLGLVRNDKGDWGMSTEGKEWWVSDG